MPFFFSAIFSDWTRRKFFNYSIAEGLPQSQVFAICQDSAGYIWAGTQGGELPYLMVKNLNYFLQTRKI
ncbi:MAG: hypothetical protein IPP49_16970 [Saprospiraceae bacterium]|nr:hypothetical protein [Saprospiraceae bacterium]